MQVTGWAMEKVGTPLVPLERDLSPGKGEALIGIKGCGICHTDLGYLYDGVPVRGKLPLVLGHEIAGVVEDAGEGAGDWIGKAVVVPAVLPCGECEDCAAGKTGICARQVFPGCDIHGGFASHLTVPARFLCAVPQALLPRLASLAVVADAITTPLNAVTVAGVGPGDVAIFVGVGGIGGFGVQIAASLGAHVVALDVDPGRLEVAEKHGASLVMNVTGIPLKEVRRTLRARTGQNQWPARGWKIFETSGTPPGQELAFSLLNHGATLMVVGFAPADVTIRLSNLMAFEARALGVWGCPPSLYPRALELVAKGSVVLDPFIETHPLTRVNEILPQIKSHQIRKRVVLTP